MRWRAKNHNRTPKLTRLVAPEASTTSSNSLKVAPTHPAVTKTTANSSGAITQSSQSLITATIGVPSSPRPPSVKLIIVCCTSYRLSADHLPADDRDDTGALKRAAIQTRRERVRRDFLHHTEGNFDKLWSKSALCASYSRKDAGLWLCFASCAIVCQIWA